jgi:hypothetical protein
LAAIRQRVVFVLDGLFGYEDQYAGDSDTPAFSFSHFSFHS